MMIDDAVGSPYLRINGSALAPQLSLIPAPHLASIAVNKGDGDVPDAPHEAERLGPIDGREWEPLDTQQSGRGLLGSQIGLQ